MSPFFHVSTRIFLKVIQLPLFTGTIDSSLMLPVSVTLETLTSCQRSTLT